ncbi:hypothetical protein JEZ13_01815 [bacterium]|nr:hypothetical protein [bacterium]
MKDEKLINRYLDGEATLKEKKDLAERKTNDPDFAALLTKFEELDKLLQKIENSHVPEDITKRVLNSIKYQTKPKPFYIRYAPALVGSLMSFVLGLIFSSYVITTQESTLDNSLTPSNDLYSTLEINDVIDYYYGE